MKKGIRAQTVYIFKKGKTKFYAEIMGIAQGLKSGGKAYWLACQTLDQFICVTEVIFDNDCILLC